MDAYTYTQSLFDGAQASVAGESSKTPPKFDGTFPDRLEKLGARKLKAWNGYGLGFELPVTLSREDVAIAKDIALFAPTLFGAARERERTQGLDFREFGSNLEYLSTTWRNLFQGVGDYGLPTFNRIKSFKDTTERVIKAARERGVFLGDEDHPLRMIAAAGSSLNFLYVIHDAILFRGRFPANYILARYEAKLSEASGRFGMLLDSKGARWFSDIKERISGGTPFYDMVCGETLKRSDWNENDLQSVIEPISEEMAQNSSFDHPKFSALVRVIRQLSREEAKDGVLVIAGGGIESRRLAQQLHRVFPSSHVHALHGKSGKKIERQYVAEFNDGTSPLLVTDERMIKRLGVNQAKLLVVYYSSSHTVLANELIPRGEENLQFTFKKSD